MTVRNEFLRAKLSDSDVFKDCVTELVLAHERVGKMRLATEEGSTPRRKLLNAELVSLEESLEKTLVRVRERLAREAGT